MPAILFFAPKAGEARRKEASRKGTNGRKERRKEGSQEGRKELKEGAKEASKSRGKEERCFIGKHCIHQVPSSSQPPSFWYRYSFCNLPFGAQNGECEKGSKWTPLHALMSPHTLTMFSRVREVVRAAFLLDAVFLDSCVVSFCCVLFLSFVRSFDSLSVWLCLKMDDFVLRRFPDRAAFIHQTWKMGPCQKDSFVDSWAFHLQWIFCVV